MFSIKIFSLIFLGLYYSCFKSCEEQHDVRSEVVSEALNYLGNSYQYAGRGPDHFDCSGLVSKVYEKVGITIRGSSKSISNVHRGIPIDDVKRGDLIFYIKQGTVFHVSIVVNVGDELIEVVHSTTSRGVIRENILASPYWKEKIHKVISLSAFK